MKPQSFPLEYSVARHKNDPVYIRTYLGKKEAFEYMIVFPMTHFVRNYRTYLFDGHDIYQCIVQYDSFAPAKAKKVRIT